MTKEQFLAALKYQADYVYYNPIFGYPKDYGGGFRCYYEKLLADAYEAKYGWRPEMWNSRFCYEITTKKVHHERPLILGDWIYHDYSTIETYHFDLACGSAFESVYLNTMPDRKAVAGETALTITREKGNTLTIPYADIAGIQTVTLQYSILPGGNPSPGWRMHYPGKHYGFMGKTPLNGIDLTNALTIPGQFVLL